jgi:hypothetical protein
MYMAWEVWGFVKIQNIQFIFRQIDKLLIYLYVSEREGETCLGDLTQPERPGFNVSVECF